MNRPFPRALVALLPSVAVLFAAAPGALADALDEKILESKYSTGDYAIYVGWHDPADWQFDEHASHAVPIGVKVRLHWLGWLRAEGDFSYFRSGKGSDPRVSVFKGPSFDCFAVGTSLQLAPISSGPVRPYLGGGPIFVSLGDDFVAFRPDVHAVAPTSPDQFVLASWGKFDLGWYAVGGLDFPVGHRALPFVEFEYRSGKVSYSAKDVHLGSITLADIGLQVSDLETVPADPDVGGRPHEGHYDWSGPVISAGLKIRF